MNTNLLFLNENASPNVRMFGEKEFIRDLKLDIILDAMADHDSYISNLCKNLLLHPSLNKSEILMRQEVMKEAFKLTDFFISMYKISVEDMENTLSYIELIHPKYDKVVSVIKRVITHVELADIHLTFLGQLCDRISISQSSISYPPIKNLCCEILQKYTPDYLQAIKSILKDLSCLKINSELVLGGHLGTGLKSSDVNLHSISEPKDSLFRIKKSDSVILLDTIVLINNSQEIVDSGLGWLLKTLSDFNQECSLLFDNIRKMFGFYVGSIKLYKKLLAKGISISFPILSERNGYCFCNLADMGLVLKNNTPVVGNTFSFSNKRLCIITGMNQGGKTTFLRSIGLAQLMSQCGLFVTADTFTCNIFNAIYTHFPNEEDRSLNKGLLEQELYRLNELVSHMQPGSLLLMNETFSTTSEYDASLMAEQIISAFCKCNITTFFVTHLYEYAHKLYLAQLDDCIFYRACRKSGNNSAFQLEEGEPLRTGSALDLYYQVIE